MVANKMKYWHKQVKIVVNIEEGEALITDNKGITIAIDTMESSTVDQAHNFAVRTIEEQYNFELDAWSY